MGEWKLPTIPVPVAVCVVAADPAAVCPVAIVTTLPPPDEVGMRSGKCTFSGDATAVAAVAERFAAITAAAADLCLAMTEIGGGGGFARLPIGGLGGALPEVTLFEPKMEKSKSNIFICIMPQ